MPRRPSRKRDERGQARVVPTNETREGAQVDERQFTGRDSAENSLDGLSSRAPDANRQRN
jgi:hypothetical protein